jgi:hypothetical protein
MNKKHTKPSPELVYDEITRRAANAGISVAALFKLIGKKDATSFQRWKKENPKSIDTYLQLDAKLKELETTKPGK